MDNNEMSDKIKKALIGLQKKIQNLKANSGNSGILQELLYEAGLVVRLLDQEAGIKIQEYRDELNFYSEGGEDNLEKFYKCKAESLSIISKSISA